MATTGDKVRAKCVVIPIEQCDEGFEHIDSGMLKRLGGSLLYELVDTGAGDKIYYDSAVEVGSSTADIIGNGESYLTSGAVDGTNDKVRFLYIKNNDDTDYVGLSFEGGALASLEGAICVKAGECFFCRIEGLAPGLIHAKCSGTTASCEVFAIINDAA